MTHAAIRQLLEQTLAAIPNAPTLLWENLEPALNDSARWWQVALNIQTRTRGVGVQAPTEYRGRMTLRVAVPQQTGPAQLDSDCQAIAEAFASGTVLVAGGLRLLLQGITRGTGITQDPWCVVPIEISWLVLE